MRFVLVLADFMNMTWLSTFKKKLKKKYKKQTTTTLY